MARPERHDVDYFPFYVKDGRTLHILEGKYQCKGTGFFTNVCRFLSQRPDHHFCLRDEGDRMWFFSSAYCDEESGMDMINIMVSTGKLDKDLWIKYQVIASEDFLDSVKDAYSKRKNECITMDEIREHYLVSGGRNTQATEFPGEETHKDDDVSGVNKPQTKLKETKENKKGQSGAGNSADKTDPKDYAEMIGKTDHFCQTLSTFFKTKKGIWQWRQQAMNDNIKAELIQECLEQLWKYRATTRDPTAYMNHIIQVKWKNANEAKAIAEHEARKLEFAEIARKIGHKGE